MNTDLVIGLAVAGILIVALLLIRKKRRVEPRCPACLRYGQAEHHGRLHCSACGANFVLNEAGQPRNIGEVVLVPLGILLLITACGVIGLLTGGVDFGIHPLGAVLVVVFAVWELYQALRKKHFKHHDQ